MEDFSRLFHEYNRAHPSAWQDWRDEKSGKQRKGIKRRVANLLSDIQAGRFLNDDIELAATRIQDMRAYVANSRYDFERVSAYNPSLLDQAQEWKTLEDDTPKLLPGPLSPEYRDTLFYIGKRGWAEEEVVKLEHIHMIIPGKRDKEIIGTERTEGFEKYNEYITIPTGALANPRIPLLLIWNKEVIAFSCHYYRSSTGKNELFAIYILDTSEALEKFLTHWNLVKIDDTLLHQRIRLYIQGYLLNKK